VGDVEAIDVGGDSPIIEFAGSILYEGIGGGVSCE
jgi:hypothetical protein